MEITSREVEVPPVRFWIKEGGVGTPLLLIHGLSGSSSWWRHNLEELATRHRVIAIDLVGFGRNRRFRNSRLPLSLEELAGVVVRFIEEHVNEQVHLVGHSMGGQIAIHVAANRPDLLRSLILVSTTGIPFRVDPRSHLKEIRKPRPQQIRFSPLLALDVLRAGPTSIALAFAYFFKNDARPLMDAIVTPTLLIWGDHDPLVPLRYGEEIHSRIAGSSLVVLPGAGHVPMWDSAPAFNRALLGFLSNADRTESPHAKIPSRFSWTIAGQREGITYRSSGRSSPRAPWISDSPLSQKEPQDIDLDAKNIQPRKFTHVLVHGLGVGTEYFRPLARTLHERGYEVLAPEIPEARDVPIEKIIETQGRRLVEWFRTLEAGRCVWIGHSTGCEVVRWIQLNHQDVVERVVHLSPVWHEHRHPWLSLITALMRDAVHERAVLLARAGYAYWNHGLLVVVRQAIAHLAAARGVPSLQASDVVAVGSLDPLADWELLQKLSGVIVIDGAPHAVHDGAPAETANAIARVPVPEGSLPR